MNYLIIFANLNIIENINLNIGLYKNWEFNLDSFIIINTNLRLFWLFFNLIFRRKFFFFSLEKKFDK